MKLHALLREKSRSLHTIAGHRSLDDAVSLMAEKKISALIIMESDQPVGIFTERDVYRYFLRDKATALSEISLQNAMTAKLIVAQLEDDVGRVMAMMIKADIRHLPVIENETIIGMLTLIDLIEHQIKSLTDEIHQLTDYIENLHEAGRD